MYDHGFYSKARIGIHKKTGIERAIMQRNKSEYPNLDTFVKRIEFMNTLDHPNIVRYLEAYEDTNFYFIVLECMKGGDIIDNLFNRGSYTEEYSATIMKQILQAIAYIHTKGIAHNKFFPINVLHCNPN